METHTQHLLNAKDVLALDFVIRHVTKAANRCSSNENCIGFYNELVQTLICIVNTMLYDVPYILTPEIVQGERIVSIPTKDISSLKIELDGTPIARLHFNRDKPNVQTKVQML